MAIRKEHGSWFGSCNTVPGISSSVELGRIKERKVISMQCQEPPLLKVTSALALSGRHGAVPLIGMQEPKLKVKASF